MGTFLSLLLYISYALFLGRIAWRFCLLARNPLRLKSSQAATKQHGILRSAKSAADILFLSRLFKVNPCLWTGEWLFHATFVFVLVRHLRYVIHPAPSWLASYQTFGICSGYVLVASLLFIFAYKLIADRDAYVSSYNFFILSLIFLISLTGILMKTVLKLDVTSVKYFMLGTFTFQPVPAPDSKTFVIHYITSMILLIFIPSHIFTAPYTMLEARKRDEDLRLVLHEK